MRSTSAAGAQIRPTAEDVFAEADMIVKVKEPLPQEYPLLREDQVLFTYLHLAPAPELTKALLERGVIGIAYETVPTRQRLAAAAHAHERGGRQALRPGGRPLPAEGERRQRRAAGRRARHAAGQGGHRGRRRRWASTRPRWPLGMGAHVTILDINLDRLRYLDDVFGGRLSVLASNAVTVEKAVADADLVIGGVLDPRARRPRRSSPRT